MHSVAARHSSPCHLCGTSDFYINRSKTTRLAPAFALFAATTPRFSLNTLIHTLTAWNLERKHLKLRRETLHVSLKSPPGIKARALLPRGPKRRGFHHERGRGTLRAIYVHVLLSYDTVTFQQKHSNRISLLNDVQRSHKDFQFKSQHSKKWSMTACRSLVCVRCTFLASLMVGKHFAQKYLMVFGILQCDVKSL